MFQRFRRACGFSVSNSSLGKLGIFATDADRKQRLLQPQDDSLSELLSAEGLSLQEATPGKLVQLVCDVWLRRGREHHTIIAGPEDLHAFGDRPLRYRVGQAELCRIASEIQPPTVEELATKSQSYPQRFRRGWRLSFATTYGWMHKQEELGIEEILVSERFELLRLKRKILSKRIFDEMPLVRY